MLFRSRDDFVDDAIFLRHFGCQNLVTLDVLADLLFLAGLENFQETHVGLGTLHGREHLTTM